MNNLDFRGIAYDYAEKLIAAQRQIELNEQALKLFGQVIRALTVAVAQLHILEQHDTPMDKCTLHQCGLLAAINAQAEALNDAVSLLDTDESNPQ